MAIPITKDNFESASCNHQNQLYLISMHRGVGHANKCAHHGRIRKRTQSQYTFAKLNVDEAREISIKLGVTSVPTFVFVNTW